MKMKQMSIWDIIAWIVLGGILLWLVLKTLGIINSPVWLEYAPLYGAVYLAGWYVHKLEIIGSEVRELKKFREATINEVNNLKINCAINHKNKK